MKGKVGPCMMADFVYGPLRERPLTLVLEFLEISREPEGAQG
jgi:hypothetical protein